MSVARSSTAEGQVPHGRNILSWNVLVREMYGIKVSRAPCLEIFPGERDGTSESPSGERERERECARVHCEREAYVVRSNINLISWIFRSLCAKRNDSTPYGGVTCHFYNTYLSGIRAAPRESEAHRVIKINFAIPFM